LLLQPWRLADTTSLMSHKKRPADSSDEPPAKHFKAQSPHVGCPGIVKATKRVGEVVEHHPDDESLCYKLSFSDGQDPSVDWFPADKVEVELVKDVGVIVRVKDTGRVGKVLIHHPNNETFSYKLEFADGYDPTADWFPADKVEVQATLGGLRAWRERQRSELKERLAALQKEVTEDFDEYKKRMKLLISGHMLKSAGKVVAGFVPGGHAVAEAASAASLADEVHAVVTECAGLADTVCHIADMYVTHTTDLASQEPRLLNVLARQVRVLGERHVIGGKELEPAHRVLKCLLDIKGAAERLQTLDEMGFL